MKRFFDSFGISQEQTAMTRESATGQRAAARLLQALDAPDDMNCEQARVQLPAFVEAEYIGQDVDTLPEYAALLQHLDRCPDCIALYTELAEDLEALVGEDDVLPAAHPSPPSFFGPARQSERVVLRVLRGIARRFELSLAAPQLAPAIATLGDGQRATLFSDSVAEVPGAPLVAVSLSGEAASAELVVAISDPAVATRWQVQVIAGDIAHTATTDEHGIARFSGLEVADVPDLIVGFSEIAA
jgi:hypothetical protein